jgi:hypothetical protein
VNGDPVDSSRETRAAARRRRPLTVAQRFVRAPLGFLWLVFLALLAVPVLAYMTALYGVLSAAKALRPGRRRERSGGRDRPETEERVA